MSMVENWASGEQERGSAVKSGSCSTLRAAAQIPAPRSTQKTRHFIIKLFPFKTNLWPGWWLTPRIPAFKQQKHLVHRVSSRSNYTVKPCLKNKINKTKKKAPLSDNKGGTQEVCFSASCSTLTAWAALHCGWDFWSLRLWLVERTEGIYFLFSPSRAPALRCLP